MANNEKKAKYPKVEAPFSLEKLDEIPKAKKTSTPEQLRKICLDFMRLQLTFPWVPKENYSYTIKSVKRPVNLSTDTIYAGLPYVNLGSGSLYRVLETYDPETGIFDFSEFKDDPQLLGNACSGAACIAWSRAISSAKLTYTSGMTQLNGYVNVGPYTYLKELPLFIKSGLPLEEDPERKQEYTARHICLENGKEVMFESYACLKPADGIHSKGHVRMVSDVHVERDEKGAIDGEKSYVLYMDQVGTPYNTNVEENEDGTKTYTYNTELFQEDGTPVYVQGGVDVKADFNALFEKRYIPFTFAEFLGEKPYEKPIMRTNNILRTSFCVEELEDIVLSCNYPISDAFIQVLTPDGKVLYKDVYRYRTHHKYKTALKDILKFQELKQFENGTNSLQINFQLFNGAMLKGARGFKGTLCPCKAATELMPDDLNFLEKLEAIPMATGKSTPEEMRQICLDFMRLQLSFPHKLSEDINYWVERQDHKVYLKKEEVHAGLPYVNVGSGSLYRWAEFFDPKTGIVDMSEIGKNKRIFGNACSGCASTSWARCITSARLGWTHEMTIANGVIPVGPYTYDNTLKSFSKEYSAKDVCRENGEQTMYESYALVKPGDGLNNPGHIRMFSDTSVVVRNADGTIDGEKSYVTFCDQVTFSNAWHHTRITEKGHYVVQGGVDVKESFASLFSHGYLPFTFKEFLGQKKYEATYIRPSTPNTCFDVNELKEISLSSNYPMSDFFYTVKDPYGKEIIKGVYRTPLFSTYSIKLEKVLPIKELAALEFIDGDYFITMDIRCYNGRVRKGGFAFAGTLTKGKVATEIPEKDKLSLRQKLNAIPIAKPGMSVHRLRQICIDMMNLQCEFPHKLSKPITYKIANQRDLPRFLDSGIVHGGHPYVSLGSGNLYRLMEVYDEETGELDSSCDWMRVPRLYGNACTGSASIAWARCVTSAKLTYWCPRHTKANGFIPIGSYQVKDVKTFTKKGDNPYTTVNVCQDNGEQVMFESYACLKLADGVISPGHIRMNVAVPTIVRNADGTIDGEKSFTLMSEQVCFTTNPNHIRRFPDGSHYIAQGFVNHKYTFKDLFDTGYLPFTFPELTGEKDVEEAYVKINTEKTAFTYASEDIKDLVISSNYPISDIFVTITDKDGNEHFRFVHRNLEDIGVKTIEIGKYIPTLQLRGTYGNKLQITCQLLNGEKLTALEAEWK